jgi:hypothetical protein
MKLGEMTIEAAAREAAGNWREFNCFCWDRRSAIPDPEKWAIIYTYHRDSTLLDQSNAAAIEETLQPFVERGDVVPECHHHWAVGHVDGFSIRVFRRGRITKAFRKYHELAQRLADHPILDEDDYNAREYEATLENLGNAAWKLTNQYELPDDWEETVYHWFANHDCGAIESSDDQGGYPSEDQLRRAFDALDYPQVELV